ncbi:hypothetical protein CTAYLR_008669, partial [Chrysophaeum taylorii]
GLRHPITSVALLGPKQTLYACEHGLLKCGPKHLYYWRRDGTMIELDAMCLLDFFVEEAFRRRGIGRGLFERMLTDQKARASCLAYDRPSSNLLPFLKKHYNLSAYVPQPTNFVIFDDFFFKD